MLYTLWLLNLWCIYGKFFSLFWPFMYPFCDNLIPLFFFISLISFQETFMYIMTIIKHFFLFFFFIELILGVFFPNQICQLPLLVLNFMTYLLRKFFPKKFLWVFKEIPRSFSSLGIILVQWLVWHLLFNLSLQM